MARKRGGRRAGSSAASHSTSAPRSSNSSAKSVRERVIDAFMRLLAEKPIEDIGLGEIARDAGVSLAELRTSFGSTLAVLAAHVRQIDVEVLAGEDTDAAEESPRERLFDVLMRRIDLLEPHKKAVRSLLRSCRRDPVLALALNNLAVRSQQWMLTAADIPAHGPQGALRAQGLALFFASVLRVWVNDDDPGNARTMAALDRALARGQRWSGFLADLCRIPQGLSHIRRRRRDRDRDEGADEGAVAV